jgi:hypothetical protein
MTSNMNTETRTLETTNFDRYNDRMEQMTETHECNDHVIEQLVSAVERKESGDCSISKEIPTRENTPPKQCSEQNSKRKGLKLRSEPFINRGANLIETCLQYNDCVDQTHSQAFYETAHQPGYGLMMPVPNFLEQFPFDEEFEAPLETPVKSNQPLSDFQKKKKTEICRNWKLAGRCKFGDEVILS